MLNMFVHVSSSILIAFHAAHACAFRGRKSRHPFPWLITGLMLQVIHWIVTLAAREICVLLLTLCRVQRSLKYPFEVQKEAAIAFLRKLLSSTHLGLNC